MGKCHEREEHGRLFELSPRTQLRREQRDVAPGTLAMVTSALEMPEGTAAPVGTVLLNDGVGALRRGDTVLIVYQKAAELKRTRWLFDTMDELLAETDSDVLVLLVVLPSSDPPDAETRDENSRRMRTIGRRVRRFVTTPVGNAFRVSVVRAIMRGLNVALGHSGTRFVADSIEEGLALVLAAKTPATPSPRQLYLDLGAIYAELGEPEPKF